MSLQKNDKTGSNRDARLASVYESLDRLDMAPYWVVDSQADHDEDDQVLKGRKAIPYQWRYSDIEPLLYEAAELITMDDSERRSIVLVNPGLAPVRATVSTLYTAYRLNDPREIMPPHRHSINAVRIGLTGENNFTGVEGEDIVFGPGDLVLTPADAWHNHGNHGDDFAVNVSILDLPLSEFLNSASFEHDYHEEEDGRKVARREQTARYHDDYSNRVYGRGGLLPRFRPDRRGTGFHSPMYVYRWEDTRELLESFRNHEGTPHDAVMVEYTDPTTGRPPFPSMTFYGQLLRPGERTLAQRQNASMVCIAFEGQGTTTIDGEPFNWSPFDAIAIPGGSWFEHTNLSESDDAVLFLASDEPTLKTLGFYQRVGRASNGGIVALD
jgi:gentisate 1,2-dioxygenase